MGLHWKQFLELMNKAEMSAEIVYGDPTLNIFSIGDLKNI